MISILCLPQVHPETINNLNYSPLALGCILIYALISWSLSARYWFKGAIINKQLMEIALKNNAAEDNIQIDDEIQVSNELIMQDIENSK